MAKARKKTSSKGSSKKRSARSAVRNPSEIKISPKQWAGYFQAARAPFLDGIGFNDHHNLQKYGITQEQFYSLQNIAESAAGMDWREMKKEEILKLLNGQRVRMSYAHPRAIARVVVAFAPSEKKGRNPSSIPDGPAIFLQSYGAYNEGMIIGEWIDASDPDELKERAEELMAKYPQYEEWGVFDNQLMPGFDSRSESLSEAIAWAERNQEIQRVAGHLDHDQRAAVLEYMEDTGSDLDDAVDAFTGIDGDSENLARELVDQIGGLQETLGKDKIASYFDYEKYARDLELGGDIVTLEDPESGELLIAWSGDIEDPDDPEDENWGRGFSSVQDYAEQLLDDVGISDNDAEMYFDWEKFGRDLEIGDYSEYGGYWFRNH